MVAQRLPLTHRMLAYCWQLPAAKLPSAVQPQGAQFPDVTCSKGWCIHACFGHSGKQALLVGRAHELSLTQE